MACSLADFKGFQTVLVPKDFAAKFCILEADTMTDSRCDTYDHGHSLRCKIGQKTSRRDVRHKACE